MLYRLEKSICGCSLQVGSMITGYAHIILGTLFTIGSQASTYIAYDDEQESVLSPILNNAILSGLIFGILYVIEMICAALLIFGAAKQKYKFLSPWLKLMIVEFFLFIILTVASFVFYLFKGMPLVAVSSIIGFLISFILPYYCFLIVYSYQEELKESETNNYYANYIRANQNENA